jgi:alpha-glucosidase
MPVMTLQAADDAFLAVHEADLRTGEPLRLAKTGPTGFRALTAPGSIAPGYAGPWRVIFFGTSPGAMVDSHLIELLNPDPQGDFSWVKPGVATWDWRIDGAIVDGFKYEMSLPSWLRMVDFSAANGIRHLVLDANWYGPEFEQSSDPVKGDKANDVKKLIAHGKQKGVGIWLYLNDVGGRKFPLEDTLAQYGAWGAAGVKYGFMRGNAVEKNARTRRITELCAKHKLLCDFHDGPVHPYGQMRTWPNAVTREYNFAQLDAKRVFQPKTFVTTVFVNMLSGPLDMNNGMFDLRQGRTTRVDNPMECPSTLVSEAARTLITFSGATILPDVPEFYQKYPGLLRFIAAQRQPWKESKTLSGVIGEHIVMARQAADGRWLVGAAANEQGKKLDIPLTFLGPGTYQATIIQDGPDAHYLKNRETLRSETRTVGPKDLIPVRIAPGGGACILIEKAR